MLESVIGRLRPIPVDREGFRTLCETAYLCFPKVWYLRRLAAKVPTGPFPRQQELRREGCVFGYPTGCKIFSVTHAWASEFHPSPTGELLGRHATHLSTLPDLP